MRPFLLAAYTLVPLLIAPTHASATSFDGSYAGVHLGYRWADLEVDTPAYQFSDGFGGTVQIPARSENYSLDGFIVGAHGGYNLVQSRNWLVGVEVDFDLGRRRTDRLASFATNRIETSTETVTTTQEVFSSECECNVTVPTTEQVTTEQTLTSQQHQVSSFEVRWQGTVRARWGYIQDDWLFYGTAGVAFMRAQWNETIRISGGSSQSVEAKDLLTGWVIGGGIENIVSANTIARIEYLYEDFGSKMVPLAFSNSLGDLATTAHKLRVGVSWTY